MTSRWSGGALIRLRGIRRCCPSSFTTGPPRGWHRPGSRTGSHSRPHRSRRAESCPSSSLNKRFSSLTSPICRPDDWPPGNVVALQVSSERARSAGGENAALRPPAVPGDSLRQASLPAPGRAVRPHGSRAWVRPRRNDEVPGNRPLGPAPWPPRTSGSEAKTQSNVLATRNPSPLLRRPVSSQPRFAERRYLGSLSHEPPRNTW